jgi:hypothetical protein
MMARKRETPKIRVEKQEVSVPFILCDVEFPRKNNTVATQALSDTYMTRIFVKNTSLPRGMSTPSEIKDRSWSTDSLRKVLRKKLEIQGARSLQGSE